MPQTAKSATITLGILITIIGIIVLALPLLPVVPAANGKTTLAPLGCHPSDLLYPAIASSPGSDELSAGIGDVMELSFGYPDAIAPGVSASPPNTPVQAAPPLGLFGQSEYMIGSVAVAVIFPESDGSVDNQSENWNTTRMNACISEITAGLTWWQNQEPRANLSFQIHSYGTQNTGYEPITRPSTDEGLWISEILTGMGYTGPTYFDQVTALNNYEMSQYGTDWAFTIFVADDLNDTDNRFTNNFCAYAYVGGPFFVMTYDNYIWTNANMDLVTAHETGHIFWATDEYNNQTECSGYLNVADNESATCVMDSNVQVVCQATRGQLGWRDSDSDNILDPVDTVPDTLFAPSAVAFANVVTPAFTGTAVEVPLTNMNPQWWATGNDVSINTVTSVQYRVDGGAWGNATAMDGAFDSQTETFTFATPALSAGSHIIEVRAENSVGNWESSFAVHTVIVDLTMPTASINPVSGFVNSLTAVSGSASDNVPGVLQEVQVQIRNVTSGSFWNGTGWSASEAWQVASGTVNWDYTLPSLQDGTAYEVKARAHDKAGNVSSVFTQSFVFDTTGPTVTIEGVPTFVNSLTALSGSADDSSLGVVDRVQIQLVNTDEDTYWNGNDWTSGATWLDAVGAVTWGYDLPSLQNGIAYRFSAKAIDGAGNESALISDDFVVDTDNPGVALDPLPPYLNSLDSVNGTAWDTLPGELETVRLQIENLTGAAYWNGSSWSTEPFWLEVGSDDSWTYPAPVLASDAEYQVSVRALDKAGNESAVIATFWFDNVAPLLDMGAIPEEVAELTEVSGTAGDSSGSGIDRVIVLVYNESKGTYWTGESWVSQLSWIKARGTNSWECTLPQLVEGTAYEVKAKAVDRAGNESSIENQSFAVKTSAPSWIWIVIGVAAFMAVGVLAITLRRRTSKGYAGE